MHATIDSNFRGIVETEGPVASTSMVRENQDSKPHVRMYTPSQCIHRDTNTQSKRFWASVVVDKDGNIVRVGRRFIHHKLHDGLKQEADGVDTECDIACELCCVRSLVLLEFLRDGRKRPGYLNASVCPVRRLCHVS